MRNHLLRALLLVPLTMACDHRYPVIGDEAGFQPDYFIPAGDAGVPDVGDATVLPDVVVPLDGGTPCRAPTLGAVRHDDPSKTIALVLPPRSKVQWIRIQKPNLIESAAAVQLGKVAGMAVSFPSGGYAMDAQARLELLRVKLANDLVVGNLGKLTVRGSGAVGKSQEGYPDIKEAVWLVETNIPLAPSALRNFVLASALNRPYSQLKDLPFLYESQSTAVLVRATMEARQGQFLLSAAVVDRDLFQSDAHTAFLDAEDLSNGTAMAPYAYKDGFYCDVGPIAKRPEADIIWVMDESGSMNDNRADIAKNALTFFSKAKAAGLDFRMGITGVKAPGPGVTPGKFCSHLNIADKYHDGGDDRFLKPGEKGIFESCILNPPYYEGGKEFVLTGAYEAILGHLPRKENDPSKIRKGAHLAVIIATDETPQELKPGGYFQGKDGFLDYTDYRGTACQLSAEKQKKVNQHIKPLLDLVMGKKVAGGTATVHMLGGLCKNSCKAELPHGYAELVKATSGQMGDICQKNLGPTLQLIINSVSASASPRVLKFVPISSTLTVDVQTVALQRSRLKGFMYTAANNSLTFNAIKVKPGHTVVAAYRRYTK